MSMRSCTNPVFLKRCPFQVLALLVGAALCVASPSMFAENKPVYVLGVFPHLPPRDLEKVFAPMAADLGKALGGMVELRTSTTYEKFSSNLDTGKYDIAFVQPFDYIRIAKQQGYELLATRTEKLAVIVVTHNDSPLNSLADLKNKKVALPPKTSAVSHLLRGHLIANGMRPGKDIQLVHQRSHVSCMQQVLIGEVVACGTAAPARRFFQGKFNVQMKIIASSQEIPHTPWVAHPRVPKEHRQLLRQRILDWANTRDGQLLLARGKLTPFVAAKDADYDIVRKMAK